MTPTPELQGLIEAYREKPPTQADLSRLRRMTPDGWDMFLDAAYFAATVPRAIVRLGVPVVTDNPRAQMAAEVQAAVDAGEALRDVAKRFKISRSTAYNMAKAKLGEKKKMGRKLSPKGIRARALLAEGQSPEEVAKETGMALGHIRSMVALNS